MKTVELVKFVGNDKNKMLKSAQLMELIAKTLEVKKYLGIKQKKALVESIVNECILYEDGIFKFDDIDKYLCFTMRVIEAYTNLELSADFEEDYDLLCQSGLLEIIIDTFKKEYDDVSILLQMKCDYVLSDNALSAQLGKFLSNLSDSLDVIIDKIEKFNIKPDVMQKLMEFMNK
jgi:hypothetical protein